MTKDKKFTKAFIFNNAGSIGIGEYVSEIEDFGRVAETINMNVTSCIILNSIFVKFFQPISEAVVVVEISSGAAFSPYATWSLYCSHKAARKMFFQVLAQEAEMVTFFFFFFF